LDSVWIFNTIFNPKLSTRTGFMKPLHFGRNFFLGTAIMSEKIIDYCQNKGQPSNYRCLPSSLSFHISC